jgi:wyosine [tRNA(Phe)-imidazoG37] synthetase (radical SAM superfamily)
MTDPHPSPNPSPIHDHSRLWRDHLYVYPVVSRRSRGLSVGVNLSRDKRCSFACAYCQVDRRGPCASGPIDLTVLRKELVETLMEAVSGYVWSDARFVATPPPMRRLNDIALSGDGEPTLLEDFDKAVGVAAAVRREMNLKDVKIVIITNASGLHRAPFHRALPLLAAGDEIWAKLDAGSEDLFQKINRPYPVISLRRILDNILAVSRVRPVVIQSLFLRLEGAAPSPAQIEAYCHRLAELVRGGGKIQLVQVYTLARQPADRTASLLSPQELQSIAERIREVIPGVPVETY